MISVTLPDRDWSLFAIIMIVVPLSAIINFWQEYRSTLNRTGQTEVLSNVYVRRKTLDGNSNEVEIDRKNIVPGDILSISPGDVIPADCIVLESLNLSVSQSRYVVQLWLIA